MGHVYVISVLSATGLVTVGATVATPGTAGASPQGQTRDTVVRLHFPVSASHVASVLTVASCSQEYVHLAALSPVGSQTLLYVPSFAAGAADSLHSTLLKEIVNCCTFNYLTDAF